MREHHTFEEGDLVAITVRRPDGTLFEHEPYEYLGVPSDPEGHPYLEWYLYRPDSCRDAEPLDRIVSIKLLRRADKGPVE